MARPGRGMVPQVGSKRDPSGFSETWDHGGHEIESVRAGSVERASWPLGSV